MCVSYTFQDEVQVTTTKQFDPNGSGCEVWNSLQNKGQLDIDVAEGKYIMSLQDIIIYYLY